VLPFFLLGQLKVFEGDLIEARDLQKDPRPWACKGTLKRLRLDFKTTSQRRLLSQTLIISRLAELEKLEDLIMTDSDLRLDLSEPKGMLDGLKSLKRLKSFSFDTRQINTVHCDWGLAEVTWVRENWPELKYVDFIQYKDEVPGSLPFLITCSISLKTFHKAHFPFSLWHICCENVGKLTDFRILLGQALLGICLSQESSALYLERTTCYSLKARAPHHLGTLRTVHVGGCGLTSVALVDMLCSLPNLEDFQADYIVYLSLIGKSWACRRTLKKLRVDFRTATQRRRLKDGSSRRL